MHHALGVPEIVATIMDSETTSNDFLKPCLLVNRLFFAESSRLLWQKVGQYHQSKRPLLQHLVRALRNCPSRAQVYAGYIHSLGFDLKVQGGKGIYATKKLDALTECHRDLSQLKFPNLQRIQVGGGHFYSHVDVNAIILQYVTPALTSFQTHSAMPLSGSFFDSLKAQTQRLASVSLDFDGKADTNVLPSDALVNFINSQLNLKYIDFLHGFDGPDSPVSTSVLHALAQHPSLESLILLDLSVSTLNSLPSLPVSKELFPKLSSFRIRAPEDVLRLIAPMFKHVRKGDISFPAQSRLSLDIFALWSCLSSLTIRCAPWCTLRGDDLICLARGCPQLVRLCISATQYRVYPQAGHGLDDSAIATMAPFLPKLSFISLVVLPFSKLSSTSLRGLGLYCRNLKHCTLSAMVNPSMIAYTCEDNFFPELSFLTINSNQVEEPGYDGHEVAARLVGILPKITSIGIHRWTTSDRAMADAFHQIVGRGVVHQVYNL